MEWTQEPGLATAEAARRLRLEGYNELPAARPRNAGAIALEVVREPMFMLLILAGAVYFWLGDNTEAAMLMFFIFLVMGITIYQETRTERVLAALRDLSSPRALVIRDGREQRIPGREVARGDLMVLHEGDRVAADGVILLCHGLRTDESLLTGESVAVDKTAGQAENMARPGGNLLPFVYSGSMVVQGQALVRVLGTGAQTEIGRIGKALQMTPLEKTPLQQQTRRLVRNLAIIGVLLCAFVVVFYALTRGNWLAGVLAGITLAMAILPEEYPVVMTVFLALGAWRIARHQVLTRRIPAIETLGEATVLCTDKTGTLTLNRMTVERLVADGQTAVLAPDAQPLAAAFQALLATSVLASAIDPFDPMEKAIHEAARAHLPAGGRPAGWQLAREYALSPALLAMSQVWQSPTENPQYRVACKGAPEAVAHLCHFSAEALEALHARVSALTESGLRVLGVAEAHFAGTAFPAEQTAFPFHFLGLIALEDPVRPSVIPSLADCYSAGVRTVMITGDYPGTARAIARQIGLHQSENVITGIELAEMNDETLRDAVRKTNIFARIVPEQKLRLVNALKADGEIVAMTGDGVNDAPALRAAHIGVAMGGRGTDVAREAAAIVLLDDDFSSIVQAIRLGRRIYANLQKAMSYIFAVHIPIAGMSLVPLVLGWPLFFFPVHVVFLQFIIDPACSIAFEAEPEAYDVMRQPPRDPRAPLFSGLFMLRSLLQGLGSLLLVLAVYGFALRAGQADTAARSMAFITLVIANVSLILSSRSMAHPFWTMLRLPNPALWWIIIGAVVSLVMVTELPFLHEFFRFGAVTWQQFLAAAGAGVASLAWYELLKGWQPAVKQPKAA